MTARELREKYLAFFQSKGHSLYTSAPLAPIDVTGREDTSLLFTGAGMVQFKPFFRGLAETPSKRLTNVQRCMRTTDIEDVGDATHLTFFEMMGNFSFGDYFKKEAIAYSWEFLTSKYWLGLDPSRLSFTVHEEDDESYGHWSEILLAAGLAPDCRIFRLGEDTNFWPAGSFTNGPPGPCGPNTEMFYWVPDDEPPPGSTSPLEGQAHSSTSPLEGEVGDPDSSGEPGGGRGYGKEDFQRDEAAGKWLEVWNDVFIQYEWRGRLKDPGRPDKGWAKEGLDPLPFASVDTGMGLERTITALTGKRSVYENDLFADLFRTLGEIVLESGNAPALLDDDPSTPNIDRLVSIWSQKGGDEAPHCIAARIIGDHTRAACFCIADGILPSNTGRGYVLRRLIRRAVLKGQRVLGIGEPFLFKMYDGVVDSLGAVYPELVERKETIVETLRNEERLFRRSVNDGYFEFVSLVAYALWTQAIWIEEVNEQLQAQVDIFDVTWRELLFIVKRRHAGGTAEGNAMLDFGARVWEIAHKGEGLGPLVSVCAAIVEEIQERQGVSDPGLKIILSGENAFQLYDTYGFPLEVTQELCMEAGIEVDLDGYYKALAEAQERSKAAHAGDSVYGGVAVLLDLYDLYDLSKEKEAKPTPTVFTGFQETTTQAKIVGALPSEEEEGLIVLALDKSPFYAEAGGEVSDKGSIRGTGFAFEVVDLIRQDGVIVHLARPIEGDFELGGKSYEEARGYLQGRLFKQHVTAEVDADRRRSITRNHTATHILHAALRRVLGKHVTQAGSLVAPDHLRFDFTHGKALSPEELERVERFVNEAALAALPVTAHENVPLDEAKKRGAMALFGEKYGDTVRMIEIADPSGTGALSLELCGGCHVGITAEIGLFKVLREGSAASGVRRIEAITGEAAYEWAREQEARLREASALLKSSPDSIVPALEKLQEQLREERRRLERIRTQEASEKEAEASQVGPVELVRELLTDADMRDATLLADRLVEGHPNRVALVAATSDGKVSLVAKAGAEAQSNGAHAGNLVRDVAKLVGGGGGGRPDFATAGGKDPAQLDSALNAAAEILRSQIST